MPTGWYLTGGAGVGLVPDIDAENGGLDLEASFDFGTFAAGGVGYAWANGLRVEGEAAYHTADVDEISVTGTGGIAGLSTGTVEGDGDLTVLAAMANVGYDLDLGGGWRPFVLAGAGGALVFWNEVEAGVEIADDSAFAPAVQGGVGVNYLFTERVSLEMAYRYFQVFETELETSAGGTFDAGYVSHNVMIGARYHF